MSSPELHNPLFSSPRERRLWLWTVLVIVAIYSTLGPARTIAEGLRERNLLAVSFIVFLILVIGFIASSWVKKRPDWRDIGVVLGVALAYLMVGVRIDSWEERTHLIEYGIVAALIHEALLERRRNGYEVPWASVLAIAATALLGFIDETIQFFMPSRIFDMRDVFFNFFAGFMVIAASLAIAPQKGPGWRIWFLWLIAAGYGWGTAVEVTGLGALSLKVSPDDLVSAFLGVAIAGILVGALQWLILRGKITGAGWWIGASAGASAIFGVVVFGVDQVNPALAWIAGMGVLGLVTGVLQWLVLRGQVRRAGWWVLAGMAGWIAGIPAGEMVGWNGLGAIYGAISGAVLVYLLRHPLSEDLTTETG